MAKAAKITIIGADGSEWVVSGPGMGKQGVELDVAPEGLTDEAPIKQIWQQSAFQEGATLLGTSIEPIDMVLGFHVFDYTDDNGIYHPWREVETKFQRALHHSKPAKIIISGVGEFPRSLEVVKLESNVSKNRHDPRLNQYSLVTATLRAPFPYWGGLTMQYNFKLSPGSSVNIRFNNRTDTYMWPKWTVTAPGIWLLSDYDFEGPAKPPKKVQSHLKAAIDELLGKDPNRIETDPRLIALMEKQPQRTVRTPYLQKGQDLVIDTYPRHETYVAADGSNIAGRMQGVDFINGIPPYTQDVTLHATYIGSNLDFVNNRLPDGLVRIETTEYWKRPY